MDRTLPKRPEMNSQLSCRLPGASPFSASQFLPYYAAISPRMKIDLRPQDAETLQRPGLEKYSGFVFPGLLAHGITLTLPLTCLLSPHAQTSSSS